MTNPKKKDQIIKRIEGAYRQYRKPKVLRPFRSKQFPLPTLTNPVSQLCTENQFFTDIYNYWCEEIKEEARLHRKQWEYVYILQALDQLEMLNVGRKGIGFGVGKEPLPAVMVKRGCSLLISDLEEVEARDLGWLGTNQYASKLGDLNDREICNSDLFERSVTYRNIDMNYVPDDLLNGESDFVWSGCALDHLGSISKGLEFITNSLKCLKSGGVAVHTTEYNVLTNRDTMDNEPTVLFRKRDIKDLEKRVKELGCEMRFNPNYGSGVSDLNYDMPPYVDAPHIKLEIEDYIATSVGLIIKKS